MCGRAPVREGGGCLTPSEADVLEHTTSRSCGVGGRVYPLVVCVMPAVLACFNANAEGELGHQMKEDVLAGAGIGSQGAQLPRSKQHQPCS